MASYNCPKCGSSDVLTRDSIHPDEDVQIDRCLDCLHVWTDADEWQNIEDLLPPVFREREDLPEPVDEEGVSVELVSFPPWEQVERILVDSSVAAFGYEPHKYDRMAQSERDRLLEEILTGGALPNSLEGVKYVFYVTGISKTFLAQLTRHRIGVSFTSVTSGNFDQRKTPYVVPTGVKNQGWEDEYVQKVQEVYELYGRMVDDGVPLENAREILPQAIHNYNVFTANFRALQTIFGIRSVEPQQPVVWKWFLGQIKDEISNVHPKLAEHLEYHNSYEGYPMDLSWSNYNQFIHPEAPEDHPAGDPDNFIYDESPRELRE